MGEVKFEKAMEELEKITTELEKGNLSLDESVEKFEEGMNIILEIETQGALQVKKKMPEAVLIFIAPPSIEELEHRLRGRHTEDEETIQKRLNLVKTELERSKQYDYVVVNDDLERAIAEVESITKKELEQ